MWSRAQKAISDFGASRRLIRRWKCRRRRRASQRPARPAAAVVAKAAVSECCEEEEAALAEAADTRRNRRDGQALRRSKADQADAAQAFKDLLRKKAGPKAPVARPPGLAAQLRHARRRLPICGSGAQLAAARPL